jgi:DNA topoisomerase-1
VFEVGLNRAVTLIAEKRAGGPGRGRTAAKPLKELGVHPVSGDAMVVLPGRYGEYIKAGKINATVPKGVDIETLTLEAAVQIVDARAAAEGASPGTRGGAKRKPPAKAAGAKPSARAKPATAAKAKPKPKAKAPARRKAPAPAS